MDKTSKAIQSSVRKMAQQYKYRMRIRQQQQALQENDERAQDRIGDQMANLVAYGVDPESIERLRAMAEQHAAEGGDVTDLRLD
jgi:hypothetical protein